MTGPAKRIALVALSPWKQGELFLSFNLACRRLHAALLTDPRLEGSHIEVFESGAIPLSEWVERITAFEPDMMAASAYLWSLPSFALLAEQVKRRLPGCLTVFGGPSARPVVLDLAPYRAARRHIDVLVLGEGEHLVVELAVRGMQTASGFSDLPGLALPSPLGWRHTPKPGASLDLNTLASPYVMGLVRPGATAYLETFRGCPMTCKFCQWGKMDAAQGVLSVELIEAELNAIAELDPVGVAVVDAGLNLNKRAFRNLVEAEERTGALAGRYLDVGLYPSLLTDDHIEFIRRCRARVGLGLHTTNPEALVQQGRRYNDRLFEDAVERLAGVSDVTVEVIVGLPGDTLDGFKETMRRISDLPCSIRVYQCLILPDALLSEHAGDERVRFHPVTLQVREAPGWSPRDLEEVCDWLNQWCGASGPQSRTLADAHGEHLEPYVEEVIDLPSWVRHVGRYETLLPQGADEARSCCRRPPRGSRSHHSTRTRCGKRCASPRRCSCVERAVGAPWRPSRGRTTPSGPCFASASVAWTCWPGRAGGSATRSWWSAVASSPTTSRRTRCATALKMSCWPCACGRCGAPSRSWSPRRTNA